MPNLYTPRISSTRSRGLLLFNPTWLPDTERISSRIKTGKERKGKRGGKKRETNWTNCTVSMGIFNYLRELEPCFHRFIPRFTTTRSGTTGICSANKSRVHACFLLSISDPDTRYERFSRLNGRRGEGREGKNKTICLSLGKHLRKERIKKKKMTDLLNFLKVKIK